MNTFTPPLSAAQVKQFEHDGYLMIPDMFDAEEMNLLIAAAKEDKILHDNAHSVEDGSGKKSKLSLWQHPGDDVWGAVARSNRVVGGMEQLLGGEVYHYHSKVMLKEPKVGGAWEWHQDYGYWYQNGCLFPYMASCMIPLDAADKGNGCLQVIKGSHLMGRVEHGKFGGQVSADPERVEEALKRMELVYCEMQPGTGLFFHGNLLHRSDDNTSERSRWTLICCYNAARNDPYKEHHHPNYTPLKKLPDTAIKEVGLQLMTCKDDFLDPQTDKTADAKKG